jgi:hypothetical protein
VAFVAGAFIAAARDGSAPNRNGRRYRPSALRDVAGCLRNHVIPELGDMRMRDVQREDLQRLVDGLAAGDLSLSRIRSVVSAIRALFAYAIQGAIVDVSPADGIDIARVECPAREADCYDVGYRAAESRGPYDDDDDDDDEWYTNVRSSRDGADDGWPEGSARGLILSLAVRVLMIVFVIIALASLVQALLIPA